ncbi:MAG: DUF3362 domain-containing protein, partial [Gammaproteobacteria bacterium]
LKSMGRADLIGNGKQHLIPAFQPKGTIENGNAWPGNARQFKTKYTDMGKARKPVAKAAKNKRNAR